MRIISERPVREFSEDHTDAASALANCKRAVRAATWRTGADVKAQFHDSDMVGDKLIAHISFATQILYIKDILTHREYDKGQWKQ